MWTLIKGSFWFSLVLVLLPVFHSGSSERLANAPPVSVADAFGMATGAYAYLTNMCTEKPDVCEKGGKTFTALGYRAKEGALIAYDYLNSKFSDDASAPAQAKTPAVAVADETARQTDTAAAATAAETMAALAHAALASAEGEAAPVPAEGGAWQPMPRKPQPYRPPVADKVTTGTVPADASAEAMPQHVPVPLPRPYPES